MRLNSDAILRVQWYHMEDRIFMVSFAILSGVLEWGGGQSDSRTARNLEAVGHFAFWRLPRFVHLVSPYQSIQDIRLNWFLVLDKEELLFNDLCCGIEFKIEPKPKNEAELSTAGSFGSSIRPQKQAENKPWKLERSINLLVVLSLKFRLLIEDDSRK